MKERNKGVEVETSSYTNEMDCYYSTSELFPCKKHPSSSTSGGGGICAYCLKDRLLKLVCSDCGEQRLSSCSCSDEITSNRNSNSCSTVEVGSVGRVSFLIENEKNETNNIFQHLSSKSKLEEKEEVLVLRRSNSNCVEIKKNGFWRIGKLFKKKNKEIKECGKSVGGFDDEKSNEMWMGVSRSRSLCSFRGGGGGGGGVFGSEDGGESVILSGARSSISAARSSGVNGSMMLESGRRSGYSEAEPRRSNFDGGGGERRDFLFENENGGRKSVDGVVMNKRVFSLRESDFKGMDESRFIDLKLDYSSSSESKNQQQQDFSSFRSGNFMGHDGCDGGSCRIHVNDRGVKRGKKSMKGWKWIFRYHSNWGNGKKRDENLMFKT